MAEIADLSIEFGHVYASERDVSADAIVEAAVSTVGSIAGAWRAAGRVVSVVVFVDDYFGTEEMASRAWENAEAIASAASGSVLSVDHLVSEAACAPLAEDLYRRLVPEPRLGTGGMSSPEASRRWVANGDSPRPVGRPPERLAAPASLKFGARDFDAEIGLTGAAEAASTPSRAHSVALDVEVHGERDSEEYWSCAFLAATWQLVRLGVCRGDEGELRLPSKVRSVGSSQPGAPLVARRTLSLLDPEFMAVEHAVRTLVGSLDLPKSWMAHLREGPDEVDHRALLQRISYLFADRDRGLRPHPIR